LNHAKLDGFVPNGPQPEPYPDTMPPRPPIHPYQIWGDDHPYPPSPKADLHGNPTSEDNSQPEPTFDPAPPFPGFDQDQAMSEKTMSPDDHKTHVEATKQSQKLERENTKRAAPIEPGQPFVRTP